MMNRRTFLYTSALTAAGLALVPRLGLAANGKFGSMTVAEFDKATKDGGTKVAAIQPTSAALASSDEQLMMEVAAGGMMQLELSRLAVTKATDEDVRAYAKGEAEEQAGLGAKLKEVAAAKKVTLPSGPDEKTKKALAMMQGLSGAEFDRTYLNEVGVKGHETLEKVMTKVEGSAKDPTLKQIAMTTLPLIKLHLQAARDEVKEMGK